MVYCGLHLEYHHGRMRKYACMLHRFGNPRVRLMAFGKLVEFMYAARTRSYVEFEAEMKRNYHYIRWQGARWDDFVWSLFGKIKR